MAKFKLLLTLIAMTLFANVSFAQLNYFTPVSGEPLESMVIGFDQEATINIDGVAISVGDEIAVFTSDGICAGAVAWTGDPVVITAYGKTQGNNGFVCGQTMHFRVWDQSAGNEYDNISATFVDSDDDATDPVYCGDIPFIKITSLEASSVPLAPVVTNPADGAISANINGTIEYEEVLNATGYDVQLSMNSDYTDPDVDQANTSSTTVSYSGLEFNTTYYGRVRAISAGGNSDWTEFTFTTLNPTEKLVNITLAYNTLNPGGNHLPVAVSVELRTGETLLSSTVSSRKAGIVGSNGVVSVNFSDVADGDYYLVVRATGFLPLAATSMVSVSNDAANYNFRTGSAQAVLGTTVMANIGGTWHCVAGDFSQDRIINAADINALVPNIGKNVTSQIPAP